MFQFFRVPRRNHKYIVKAGGNFILALPKGFAQQPFQSVADDSAATSFSDRDTQSWIAAIVFCHIKRKQPVAETQITSQDSFELLAIDEPFVFSKRKVFQESTTISDSNIRFRI